MKIENCFRSENFMRKRNRYQNLRWMENGKRNEYLQSYTLARFSRLSQMYEYNSIVYLIKIIYSHIRMNFGMSRLQQK